MRIEVGASVNVRGLGFGTVVGDEGDSGQEGVVIVNLTPLVAGESALIVRVATTLIEVR
jgi:hypothetical protein